MSSIRTLCFFCGGATDVDERYKQTAREAGALCGAQGWNVVYGGAHIGLMGLVADSALAAGVKVTGVIPHHLKKREIAHTNLTKLEVTETMHERQQRMADLADAFVILPGGLGTLAEFFEVLTWKQLRLHEKPIVVVNTGEYWNFLIQTVDRVFDENFLHRTDKPLFTVIDAVRELPGALSGQN